MDTLEPIKKKIINDIFKRNFDFIDSNIIENIINDMKLDYNLLNNLFKPSEIKNYLYKKISEYSTKIIKKNDNVKNINEFKENIIDQMIENNKFTILMSSSEIGGKDRLSFKTNIFLRMGIKNTSFINIIENITNTKINDNIIKKIYKNISDKTGINITEIIELLEFKYRLSDKILDTNIIDKIVKIINILLEEIYNHFSLSICIFSYRLKAFNFKNTFIYEKQYIPNKLYFINLIFVDNDNIYFEPLYVLNLDTKIINPYLNDINHIEYIINLKELELKIKPNLQYNPIFLENEDIKEIEFDPYDKDQELPVIEIELGNEKRNFLLGKTNNLYEDDNHMNNLVGKLKFTDDSYTEAKIYWCKGYIE
jgi:hypothetical protein